MSIMSAKEKTMADSAVRSLRESIDTKISQLSPAVRERVTEHFVDAELDRRAKIILAGVNALREAESDLNKINRGDVPAYDQDGKLVSQTFTKGRLGEIKKAKDRIIKLEFSINKAISDAAVDEDFVKLEKAIKSKGQSKPDEDADEE